MAHNVIDDSPWFENIIQQTSIGWALQLGPAAVDQLSLNEGFVIHLDNGINVVLANSFKLRKNAKMLPVYLEELLDETAVTSQLIRQPVRRAFSTSAGTLEITFGSGAVEELTLVVRSPNWRIKFPNASTCYGLREGGIGMLPP